MKRTELEELRTKSIDELKALVQEKKEALFRGRVGQALEGEGLGVQERKIRRDIARILTLIRSAELAAAATEEAN